MYNLIEYWLNYCDTTGSLWFYLKDEATNTNPGITDTGSFKSIMYKVKLLENIVAQPNSNNANGIL